MGLDALEPCAGEERDEHGIDDGAIVAADKEPVSTPEDPLVAHRTRLHLRRG